MAMTQYKNDDRDVTDVCLFLFQLISVITGVVLSSRSSYIKISGKNL